MANTKIPVELSSTPGIVDNSNATAITIDSSENVGIGTTNPTSKVDIRGANTAVQGRGQLYLTNTDSAAINNGSQIALGGTYDGTSDTFFATIAGRKENSTAGNFQGYLQFATRQTSGNVERMRIDSSGNVGIGTSSPSATLNTQSTVPDTNIRVGYDANKTTRIGTTSGGDAQIYAYETGVGYHNILLAVDSGSAAGNVGIGCSPSNALDVQTSAGKFSVEALGSGSVRLASNGSMGMNVAAGYSYEIDVGGSEVFRIDSGGRVMIAETSNTGYSANADDLIVGDNGSATERGISIGATSGGSIRWNDGSDTGIIEYAHSSDSMRLYTAGLEAMRIDSSGRVLINTTSATLGSGQAGDLCVSSKIKIGGYSFIGEDLNDNDSLTIASDTSESIIFAHQSLGTFTETARIASTGNLLVGTSYDAFNARANIYASGSGTSTITLNLWNGGGSGCIYERYVNSGGAAIGSITQNGASAVAYNTSSDARLKNVTGSARGLEVINELNPVAYNWKEDGKADEGLIAQEVMDIVPNAVTGSEEEMYQMDYSKLVVHLVKGMKEQQAQIEALQSEINELKNS